jgi:hypothetical protein
LLKNAKEYLNLLNNSSSMKEITKSNFRQIHDPATLQERAFRPRNVANDTAIAGGQGKYLKISIL